MLQTLVSQIPSVYECLVTIGEVVYDTLLNIAVLFICLAFIGGYLAIFLLASTLGLILPARAILMLIQKRRPSFLDSWPGLVGVLQVGQYGVDVEATITHPEHDYKSRVESAEHGNIKSVV